MGRQIIMQPNGKYAIWSSIVDNFILLDAEPEEIVEEFLSSAKQGIKFETDRIFKALNKGDRPYYQFTKTWEEAIKEVKRVHGAKDETLQIIKDM